MQDRGDIVHVVGIGSLSLNDGSQGDNLIQGHAGICDFGLQIVRQPLFKVRQQLAHHISQLFPFIKIIGIGEQVSLQLIILAGGIPI